MSSSGLSFQVAPGCAGFNHRLRRCSPAGLSNIPAKDSTRETFQYIMRTWKEERREDFREEVGKGEKSEDRWVEGILFKDW